ncbi:MAG: peptidoglycan bridge formation glycyltransferase FemA/FemB family protein [Patescibacteria group bacterium]
MEVKEINDKEKWDGFLAKQTKSQFLQSWDWGEFKKALGVRIWRLGILNEGNLVGAGLVLKSPLPLHNNYLYLPRGPVFSFSLNSEEISAGYQIFTDKIKEIAKQEDSIFLKIEPAIEKPFSLNLEKIGYHSAKNIQPPDTVILDLAKTEEELLAEMHPKTRYNIRLAERKGVKIIFSQDKKDIDVFYKLCREVNEREKINSFSQKYYEKMFEAFGSKFKIIKAEFEGKTLAVNLNLDFGDLETYNHGASCSECRNVMAPHLLQWESIRQAKKEGYKYYDFRGIAPTDDEKHKWAGITRFKKSFSPKTTHYLGAYDFIFKSMLYQLYLLGKNLKK